MLRRTANGFVAEKPHVCGNGDGELRKLLAEAVLDSEPLIVARGKAMWPTSKLSEKVPVADP